MNPDRKSTIARHIPGTPVDDVCSNRSSSVGQRAPANGPRAHPWTCRCMSTLMSQPSEGKETSRHGEFRPTPALPRDLVQPQ